VLIQFKKGAQDYAFTDDACQGKRERNSKNDRFSPTGKNRRNNFLACKSYLNSTFSALRVELNWCMNFFTKIFKKDNF